jgi:hypothetical protein
MPLLSLQIIECSGILASSPKDQTNTGTGTSTSPSSGNISTGFANEVVFGFMSNAGTNNPEFTLGGSFINTGLSEINDNVSHQVCWVEYQVLNSTQTIAATATSATNADWIAAVASFQTDENPAPPTKITFINAGAQTASNASPQSPALPTNHAAGDLLLLFCIQASAAAITFTPPAGWTSIARNSNATRSMTIEVFAKIDNGSESAPSTACSSAAGGWATQIGCWRNVDDGVISDATAVSSDSAAAATFQPTGITTGTPNAWVISYVGTKDDNALNFNTANGYTARMSGASYDDTAGNGSDYSVGVADQEFSTTGAKTCPTWNESTNGNDAWVALTLALRPKTLVWGGRPDGRAGAVLMTQLLAT